MKQRCHYNEYLLFITNCQYYNLEYWLTVSYDRYQSVASHSLGCVIQILTVEMETCLMNPATAVIIRSMLYHNRSPFFFYYHIFLVIGIENHIDSFSMYITIWLLEKSLSSVWYANIGYKVLMGLQNNTYWINLSCSPSSCVITKMSCNKGVIFIFTVP